VEDMLALSASQGAGLTGFLKPAADVQQDLCEAMQHFQEFLFKLSKRVEMKAAKFSGTFALMTPGVPVLLMLSASYFSAINSLVSASNGLVAPKDQFIIQMSVGLILAFIGVLIINFLFLRSLHKQGARTDDHTTVGVSMCTKTIDGKCPPDTFLYGEVPKSEKSRLPLTSEKIYNKHLCPVEIPCKICPKATDARMCNRKYYVGEDKCKAASKDKQITLEDVCLECPYDDGKFGAMGDVDTAEDPNAPKPKLNPCEGKKGQFYVGHRRCTMLGKACDDCPFDAMRDTEASLCPEGYSYVGRPECRKLSETNSISFTSLCVKEEDNKVAFAKRLLGKGKAATEAIVCDE